MATEEKRTSRRAPVSLRVRLRYASIDSFVDRFAANVSHGGMFLSSRSPKPEGTKLRFELLLADGTTALSGYGVVQFLREAAPSGMGVEFTRLTRESRELVGRMVARRQELGLPDLGKDLPQREDSPEQAPAEARDTGEQQPEASAGEQEPGADAGEQEPEADAGEQEPEADAGEQEPEADAGEQEPEADAGEQEPQANAGEPEPDRNGPTGEASLESLLGHPLDLSRALARARSLAEGSGDDELEALLRVRTAPVAASARDASRALLALSGSEPRTPADQPAQAPVIDDTAADEDAGDIEAAPAIDEPAADEPQNAGDIEVAPVTVEAEDVDAEDVDAGAGLDAEPDTAYLAGDRQATEAGGDAVDDFAAEQETVYLARDRHATVADDAAEDDELAEALAELAEAKTAYLTPDQHAAAAEAGAYLAGRVDDETLDGAMPLLEADPGPAYATDRTFPRASAEPEIEPDADLDIAVDIELDELAAVDDPDATVDGERPPPLAAHARALDDPDATADGEDLSPIYAHVPGATVDADATVDGDDLDPIFADVFADDAFDNDEATAVGDEVGQLATELDALDDAAEDQLLVSTPRAPDRLAYYAEDDPSEAATNVSHAYFPEDDLSEGPTAVARPEALEAARSAGTPHRGDAAPHTAHAEAAAAMARRAAEAPTYLDDLAAPTISAEMGAAALDADSLMASGIDRLAGERRNRPLSLDDPPDLASFADPPDDAPLVAMVDASADGARVAAGSDLDLELGAFEEAFDEATRVEEEIELSNSDIHEIAIDEADLPPENEPNKKKGLLKRFFGKS